MTANGGTVRLRAPLIGSDDVAINPVVTEIRGARSITVEAFKVFDTHNSAFNGVIDPIAQPDFYGSCSAPSGSVVCSGTLVEFVRNFSLSSTAQQKFASIPAGNCISSPESSSSTTILPPTTATSRLPMPGIFGSGFAGFLTNANRFTANVDGVPTVVEPGTVITDQYGVLLPQYANYKRNLVFVPGVSAITSLNYRVGGSPTGEPGTLTLRAVHDVKVNASITDGFFSTRNVFDPTLNNPFDPSDPYAGLTYQDTLASWASTIGYFTISPNTSGGCQRCRRVSDRRRRLPLCRHPPVPYDPAGKRHQPCFQHRESDTYLPVRTCSR